MFEKLKMIWNIILGRPVMYKMEILSNSSFIFVPSNSCVYNCTFSPYVEKEPEYINIKDSEVNEHTIH